MKVPRIAHARTTATAGRDIHPERQDGARRRVPMYGCVYHHKRGAIVCKNDVVIRQELLDAAFLDVMAEAIDERRLARAVTKAVDRLQRRVNDAPDQPGSARARARPHGGGRAAPGRRCEAGPRHRHVARRVHAQEAAVSRSASRGGVAIDSARRKFRTAACCETKLVAPTGFATLCSGPDSRHGVPRGGDRRPPESILSRWWCLSLNLSEAPHASASMRTRPDGEEAETPK